MIIISFRLSLCAYCSCYFTSIVISPQLFYLFRISDCSIATTVIILIDIPYKKYLDYNVANDNTPAIERHYVRQRLPDSTQIPSRSHHFRHEMSSRCAGTLSHFASTLSHCAGTFSHCAGKSSHSDIQEAE